MQKITDITYNRLHKNFYSEEGIPFITGTVWAKSWYMCDCVVYINTHCVSAMKPCRLHFTHERGISVLYTKS